MLTLRSAAAALVLAACSRSTPEQRDAAVIHIGIPAPPPPTMPASDGAVAKAATAQPADPVVVVVQTRHGNVKLPAIDRDPIASPSGDSVVYARGDDLYLRGEFSEEEHVLVRGAPSTKPEENLTTLNSPRFSPDGDRVYFLSAAWGNTEAVHAVDLATKRVSFVVEGKRMDVVRKGPLRSDLVVVRERVGAGGGAPYDEAWLVGPDGKEIRALARMDAPGAERIVTGVVDGGAQP